MASRPLQTTAQAASTTSPATVVPEQQLSHAQRQGATQASDVSFEYACPICQQTKFKVSGPSQPRRLHCARCGRGFASNATFVDLTLTSGLDDMVYKERYWPGTELFRTSLVSFVYERGWRQGFRWAGFPGVEEEFRQAMQYLRPVYGHVLLDMSCGSGLFSRRFVQSNQFDGVIAADFSDNMLKEASRFFAQDQTLDRRQYTLLRADVGRLPFAAGSLQGVHAGAAMHCWPNPAAAMAEISRVLAPGGVFVASTFLKPFAPLGQVVGDNLVRPLNQATSSQTTYRWWEEQELRDLCATVGLQDFQRIRKDRFILFTVRKPVLPADLAAED